MSESRAETANARRVALERDPAPMAAAPRPRPPKSFASRFWGAIRAASGALGRRPRWFWRWAWYRELDALCVDRDRARQLAKAGAK